jgi:hypothetical protein
MGSEKILSFFRHTTAANTEKIQPVIKNFKISFQCHLFFHFIQAVQDRIDNFFTPDTDDVGMGSRFVSIVSVTPIREAQLKNFTKRFKQYNISVNRGKTHCGKIRPDLLINIFNTGMALTHGKNLNNSQPLGRYLVAIFPQFPDNGVSSFIVVGHRTPPDIK